MKYEERDIVIISLLDNICRHLGINNDHDIDSGFIRLAIAENQEWAISYKYAYALGLNADLPDDVDGVINALYMWRIIEESINNLSEKDKEKLKKNSNGFIPHFEGFSKNDEREYFNISEFVIKNFDTYKNRCYTYSPLPKYEKYCKMYSLFSPINIERGHNYLTVDDIIKIINC